MSRSFHPTHGRNTRSSATSYRDISGRGITQKKGDVIISGRTKNRDQLRLDRQSTGSVGLRECYGSSVKCRYQRSLRPLGYREVAVIHPETGKVGETITVSTDATAVEHFDQ